MSTSLALLSQEGWEAKWLRLDQGVENMVAGRGCLGSLDCLDRAAIAIRILVDGREIEVGLCHAHAADLPDELTVLKSRELTDEETLDEHGGC